MAITRAPGSSFVIMDAEGDIWDEGDGVRIRVASISAYTKSAAGTIILNDRNGYEIFNSGALQANETHDDIKTDADWNGIVVDTLPAGARVVIQVG